MPRRGKNLGQECELKDKHEFSKTSQFNVHLPESLQIWGTVPRLPMAVVPQELTGKFRPLDPLLGSLKHL